MQIKPEQLEMLIKLQEFFKEKMGEKRDGDMIYNLDTNGVFAYCVMCTSNPYNGKQYLRIPLALDPECSERCLWGMVDWEKRMMERRGELTSIKRFKNAADFNNPEFPKDIESDNPTTALLKALIEQEGL